MHILQEMALDHVVTGESDAGGTKGGVVAAMTLVRNITAMEQLT